MGLRSSVQDAFTTLGQDKSKLDEIGNLGEEEFPTSRLQKLEDELKKEKDAAIKFKQIDDHLSKIQSQVKDFNIDVTDVKTLVEGVGSDVRDIFSEVVDERKTMKAEGKSEYQVGNARLNYARKCNNKS